MWAAPGKGESQLGAEQGGSHPQHPLPGLQGQILFFHVLPQDTSLMMLQC